jgi:hypothetical protein
MNKYILLAFILVLIGCKEQSKNEIVKETVVDNGRNIHVEIITTGYGDTRLEATYEAINEAIKKVLGQNVDIKTRLSDSKISGDVSYSGSVLLEKEKQSLEIDYKGRQKTDANIKIVDRNIIENTKGLVKTYETLEEKLQNEKKWFVRLKTTIIKRNLSSESSRIRIAVASFRVSSSKDIKYSDIIFKKITDQLVKTQKFAIPDKDYTKEQHIEKNLINDKDMSVSELSLLGNKLSVDYVLAGKVEKVSSSKIETKSKITGNVVHTVDKQSVKISFRLLDLATGLITLTGVYSESGSDRSIDTLINEASDFVVNYIVAGLVPLYIEKLSGDIAYIAIGGDSVKIGQRYKIIQYISEIKNNETGELLGYEEKQVGLAEVEDVQTKITKARIIDSSVDFSKEFKPRTFIVRAESPSKSTKPKEQTTKLNKSKNIEQDSDW